MSCHQVLRNSWATLVHSSGELTPGIGWMHYLTHATHPKTTDNVHGCFPQKKWTQMLLVNVYIHNKPLIWSNLYIKKIGDVLLLLKEYSCRYPVLSKKNLRQTPPGEWIFCGAHIKGHICERHTAFRCERSVVFPTGKWWLNQQTIRTHLDL